MPHGNSGSLGKACVAKHYLVLRERPVDSSARVDCVWMSLASS